MQFPSEDLQLVARSMGIACQYSPSLFREPGGSRCDIHAFMGTLNQPPKCTPPRHHQRCLIYLNL